jgi:hypothetical protein
VFRAVASIALFLLAALGTSRPGSAQAPAQPAARTFYVDCLNGDDSRSGMATGQAWRSLNRANGSGLAPGDALLFKRGCTWSGTLKAAWTGTATARITIGAYGAGSLPRFVNSPGELADGFYNAVEISGSYQVVEYLAAGVVDPPVHAGCANNPIGWFAGFNFRNPDNSAAGGSYNILRDSRASGFTIGAHTNNNTHHNQILNNTLTENRVMDRLTPASEDGNDDLGAWGILLKGSYHEVAFNYFADNNAFCTFDTPPQGNSVELYEARYNTIHHNTAVGDRDFSEIGGSAAIKSDGNTFAYNLVVSAVADAHFVVLRGAGSGWGPTWRTTLYNNTVYLTGAASEALVCGAGCSDQILTARNNILWAERKAAFADGPFNESHNIYWNSNGDPFVQFLGFNLNATSQVADPRFSSSDGYNFRLAANSPAVDRGTADSFQAGFTFDLLHTALPQRVAIDIGAYEYYPVDYNRALFLPLARTAP